MSFVVLNKTNGLADINLFDGSRSTLLKGQSLPLKHEPTEAEVKYYAKLNCVGIYLEKRAEAPEVKTPVEEPVTHPVEDKVIPPAEEPKVEQNEVTSTEDTPAVTDETFVDYISMDLNKLMQMRQAELIEIAHSLGHEEANTDLSKKEICKLIRGE